MFLHVVTPPQWAEVCFSLPVTELILEIKMRSR